jgi:hypothetical protein
MDGMILDRLTRINSELTAANDRTRHTHEMLGEIIAILNVIATNTEQGTPFEDDIFRERLETAKNRGDV